ncbi:MAG: hypothetical protein E2O91_02860 [Alphaproteobacteria bacterium]|nr:MAG: hypothetical protein E2O91_02860 [Alphaproteobacteria bacterium]
MTNESLETTLLLFFLFYIIASFGVSVWLSIKKNEALLAANSKLMPYKWGYYWGYFSILVAPMPLFLLWYSPQMGAFEVGATPTFIGLKPTFDQILVEAMYSLSFALIGVGIIKRIPLAWIASAGMFIVIFIFQFQWMGLVIAAINGYYAWKRRQELNFLSFFKKK